LFVRECGLGACRSLGAPDRLACVRGLSRPEAPGSSPSVGPSSASLTGDAEHLVDELFEPPHGCTAAARAKSASRWPPVHNSHIEELAKRLFRLCEINLALGGESSREDGLMVIDVLTERPSPRHHDWLLSDMQSEHDRPRTSVAYDQRRCPYLQLHLAVGKIVDRFTSLGRLRRSCLKQTRNRLLTAR
jgi:hypothetical protein